jgi:uncharacterized protein Smg (DUF494 family)
MKLTKEEALDMLRRLAKASETDAEQPRAEADDVLLRLIDDPEITQAYQAVEKWYA